MALLILALLQRIFLMSSLMLLLVWLIFFRSEERFSRNAETDLVCRLLLEKKNSMGIAALDHFANPLNNFGFTRQCFRGQQFRQRFLGNSLHSFGQHTRRLSLPILFLLITVGRRPGASEHERSDAIRKRMLEIKRDVATHRQST